MHQKQEMLFQNPKKEQINKIIILISIYVTEKTSTC
jgi:hypothetical protein